MKTEYSLQCVLTGRKFEDSGWSLSDPQSEKPSLIRAIYSKKQITFGDKSLGIYRFADWLPIKRSLVGSAAPVTYRSEGLAKVIGLNNLYITFSGFFPERGAFMKSCSFKETEAYSVCGRLSGDEKGVLVVASAGNTARAFASVCSKNNIPIAICVPHDNISALWFDEPINPCVKLFTTQSGSDYFDAISLSNEITKNDGFFPEGGATNIARRDGMATTYLSAVEYIGKIPDYYFQSVGSGTGAIAAWEANLRMIEDGRFGAKKTKLILSQNAPFLLMERSWRNGSRDLVDYDPTLARHHAAEIDAKVLSNRKPPYSIHGGLFDALKDSNGDILSVSNEALRSACKLFLDSEGIDIYSAAAVAVQSLVDSVNNGTVDKDAIVMLNITGGGEARFKRDHEVHQLSVAHTFPIDFTPEQVAEVVKKHF